MAFDCWKLSATTPTHPLGRIPIVYGQPTSECENSQRSRLALLRFAPFGVLSFPSSPTVPNRRFGVPSGRCFRGQVWAHELQDVKDPSNHRTRRDRVLSSHLHVSLRIRDVVAIGEGTHFNHQR